MGRLESIFSKANLMNYAKACVGLAMDIPEIFEKEKLDTLVIPSRGAVPFFLGMNYGIEQISNSELASEEVDNFYQNLGVQDSLLPLLPENSGIKKGSLEDKAYRVLLAPFTADLNLNKFDENEDTDEYILKTRQYWANVTASMFLPREERKKDPYFKSFADVVLRHIEKRDDVAELYENFPTINKFGIMDTVISGRASNNILKAFDKLSMEKKNPNLQPYSFLIVDEDGKKLRSDFERYLRGKKYDSKASFYPIHRIVSEDENASLLGVGAVVYPSVMKASKEMLTLGEDKEFFIGAGSWRLDEDLGKKRENNHINNFDQFMDLIYSGIDLDLHGDQESFNIFSEKREKFLDTAYENNILGQAVFDPKYISKQVRYSLKHPYETRSFVFHAPFSKNSTRKIISQLRDIPEVYVGTGTGGFKIENILRFKHQRDKRK